MNDCPVCAATVVVPLRGPQAPWHYLGCSGCGHHWLDPMPDDQYLAAYYNGRYQVPEARYRAAVIRSAPGVKQLLRTRHPERGRLLEIGASYGAMLDALAQDGWTVVGVELDARAAERARATGLDVRTGNLGESGFPAGGFDVITMFHVIEHVTQPVELLATVHGLLRPGGTLLIKTPNAYAAVARALSGWWEWFAAPEHVHVYSPDSLRHLLGAHGLRADVMLSGRGDANSAGFELLRATARRLLQKPGPGASVALVPHTSLPVSQRGWYRTVQAGIEAAGAPLEALLAPAYRRLRGPELTVLARAEARAP